MSFAPGLRVGRYEVVRKLGQGGFGVLFVARDTELDREVALKFLRPEHVTRPEVVQRFLQEARSAAKINHPGIVTVFECGQVANTGTDVDGTVYIAMELLHGESLHQRLKRERRLPPELAINIVRQVCSALMAAHLASIVHRDLKPDNLFLIADPAVRGGVRVKVLDFGIAKLADGYASGIQTHSLLVLGTPMYMSPEQCKSSAKVDHRSDIYALGCILYQLICGTTPYVGDAGELIAKHQLAPVPEARSLVPDLAPALETLLAQMLAKAPDARPESMEAVETALATMDATPSYFEGVDERTTIQPKKLSRSALVAGAGAVIVLGVALGVLTTRRSSDVPVAVVVVDAAPVIEPLDAAVVAAVPLDAPGVVIDAAEVPVDAAEEIEVAPVVVEKPPTNKPKGAACDASAAKAKGDDYVANGMDTAALAQYDLSLRCKPDAQVMRLAYMSACKAKNPTRAKALWAKMSSAQNQQLKEICVRYGITLDDCDATAAKAKGDDYTANGMDTAALAQYELSLRCEADPVVLRLAYMSACKAKSSARAKALWARMSSAQNQQLKQICVRYGVTLD